MLKVVIGATLLLLVALVAVIGIEATHDAIKYFKERF